VFTASTDWRRLTPDDVEHIHKAGGTVLGSSRGGFDLTKIVDSIETRGLSMVFIAGGDGTAIGAKLIYDECRRRRLRISICHVPKTVDRDIPLLDNTFGFDTAVEEAQRSIKAASVEAASFPDCISIGRSAALVPAYPLLL
jgi:6-phosphofructokinase 1